MLCEDRILVHPHSVAANSLAKAVFIHWLYLRPVCVCVCVCRRETRMNGTRAELTVVFVSGSHLN